MAKKTKGAKRGGGPKKPARSKPKGRKSYAPPKVESSEEVTEEQAEDALVETAASEAGGEQPEAEQHAANGNGHANGSASLPPPPEGTKRVFRQLPCPLSDAEKDRLRRTMHDAEAKIIALKEERKALNADIDSARGERKEAAIKSKSGAELRTVECLLVPSYSENCMRTVRTDVAVDDPERDHPFGKIIDTRALTSDERTGNLFDNLPNELPPEPAVDADDEEAMKRLAEEAASASEDGADADDMPHATDDELGPADDSLGDDFDDDDDFGDDEVSDEEPAEEQAQQQ